MAARAVFPAGGTHVLCEMRGGEMFGGEVTLVWLAMDTECINVRTPAGVRHVFPELGDRWVQASPEEAEVLCALAGRP